MILTFILKGKLQKMFDLAIEFTVNPPADGLGSLSSSSLATFIQNIATELSPKWERTNTLSPSATTLVEKLFKEFENTALLKQSDLEAKPRVYRNVCLYFLCH